MCSMIRELVLIRSTQTVADTKASSGIQTASHGAWYVVFLAAYQGRGFQPTRFIGGLEDEEFDISD